MSLRNDAFGRTVTMETSDVQDVYRIGDTYNFPVPKGTPLGAVYLGIAKQEKIESIKNDLREHMRARYSLEDRVALLYLLEIAKTYSYANRIAYINRGLEWVGSLIHYAKTVAAEVQALTNEQEVIDYNYDFFSAATDPEITLIGAANIED